MDIRPRKVKNVYDAMLNYETFFRCVEKSQHNKAFNLSVIAFNNDYYNKVSEIYETIRTCSYVPGPYRKRKIYEPKERILKIPPYCPDRIIDHCVVAVMEPVWKRVFTLRSYSCIKGMGIHACQRDIKKALQRSKKETAYALEIDVHKYYDNIVHSILKTIIRRSLADTKMLRLLDAIIDSNEGGKGLPIGRYTSQYFANLYLSYFDHLCLEVLDLHDYFRYMDNILVLSDSKEKLHDAFTKMALYLASELHLELNANWQIYPTGKRDIDMVGYRMSQYDTRMRKTIFMRFMRKVERTRDFYKLEDERDVAHAYPSEYGWLLACSDNHKKAVINKIITHDENTKFAQRHDRC